MVLYQISYNNTYKSYNDKYVIHNDFLNTQNELKFECEQ